MKRILMTADTVGGVWTYALDLVRALRPHGIEVSLASMGQPLSADQQRASRTIENLKVFESNFRVEWMEDAWNDVADAVPWLLKTRDRVQPDVIHLNGFAHGALPWGAPVLIAGHSCVFSWWKAVHGTAPPETWRRYKEEVAKGLQAAGHVVAPSLAMLNSLKEHYGPLKSGGVIPNGRDPEMFRPGRKAPLILCAGRLWDEAKNIRAVMNFAEHSSWPVYLAGEDQFGPARQRIDGKIRYLGHLPAQDLAMWMSRASIFVSPARYEPFGLSILEAALSGCALVLGDIPSLRESWEDAAFFVAPDDRAGLKNTIEQLIQDPSLLNEWAARAGNRASTFTPERMVAGYVELYRTLCGSFSSITR